MDEAGSPILAVGSLGVRGAREGGRVQGSSMGISTRSLRYTLSSVAISPSCVRHFCCEAVGI